MVGDAVLVVDMPDGSQWAIPLQVIVASRAAWDVERGIRPPTEYDDDELIEWATNDMNWSDMRGARYVGMWRPTVGYEDAWPEAPKRVRRG